MRAIGRGEDGAVVKSASSGESIPGYLPKEDRNFFRGGGGV